MAVDHEPHFHTGAQRRIEKLTRLKIFVCSCAAVSSDGITWFGSFATLLHDRKSRFRGTQFDTAKWFSERPSHKTPNGHQS